MMIKVCARDDDTTHIASESLVPLPAHLPRKGETMTWEGVSRTVVHVHHNIGAEFTRVTLFLSGNEW